MIHAITSQEYHTTLRRMELNQNSKFLLWKTLVPAICTLPYMLTALKQVELTVNLICSLYNTQHSIYTLNCSQTLWQRISCN